MVMANVSLAGNISKGGMYSDMTEFGILKAFSIACHLRIALAIIKVNWFPPSCNWIKCNSDGPTLGAPGTAACSLGSFSAYLGNAYAYHAELVGAMIAIEIFYKIG